MITILEVADALRGLSQDKNVHVATFEMSRDFSGEIVIEFKHMCQNQSLEFGNLQELEKTINIINGENYG